MKINIIEKIIGSVFFTGYIPIASGTFGSFVALVIYFIPGFENPTYMILAISLFFILGISISDKFEKIYGKDPKQCTIDELVGTWIALLFVPKTLLFVSISFVLWRISDIIKPFPARQLESLKGGLGIMIDDIIAAIYSLIVTHIIIYFTKWL
jgi:phosphatidylglycerophosphatase A